MPEGIEEGMPSPADSQDPYSNDAIGVDQVTSVGLTGPARKPSDLSLATQQRIVDKVIAFRNESRRHMEQLYPDWNNADAQYIAYIADEKRATGRKVKKSNPYAKRIYVPYSLATVQSMMAYQLQVFTGRRPYFELEGRAGNTKDAQRMELVMDAQADQMNLFLRLYGFLLDGNKYGIGYLSPLWRRTLTATPVLDPVLRQVLGDMTMEVDFEGPWTTNVDPFNAYPDPNAPLGQPQEGEFFIFEFERSYLHLKRREIEGVYEDVQRMKPYMDGPRPNSVATRRNSPERNEYRGFSASRPSEGEWLPMPQSQSVRRMGIINEAYCWIIPSEWEVGPGEAPELWVFTVGEDQVLLRCHAFPYAHKQLPVCAWEPLYDAHAAANPGWMKITSGEQEVINWLVNSRMENVRTAMNVSAVVDEKKIMLEDLIRPQPGRVIRKVGNWEGDLGQAFKSLVWPDVTASHARDLEMMQDLFHRTTAQGDNQQGVVTPEKRTASEARIAAGGSQGRMALITQLCSAQGLSPMAAMWIVSNQQFLSTEREYAIVGEKSRYKDLRDGMQNGRVRVARPNIQGLMRFITHDGTLPVDPAQNSADWQEIFSVIATSPILQQIFSIPEVFRARVNAMPGERKDIDDFLLEQTNVTGMSIVPDDLSQVPDNATPVPVKATYG